MNTNWNKKYVIDKEIFEEARSILVDEIDFEEYYRDNIDPTVYLDGGNILCPLHDENTPSFRYSKDKNVFHCFGCGAKGSVVELHHKLVRRERGTYSIYQAVKDLSKEYGVTIPDFEKIDLVKKVGEKFGIDKRLEKRCLNVKNLGNMKPLKVLEGEIEEKLKKLRMKDFDRYMSVCKEYDIILIKNGVYDEEDRERLKLREELLQFAREIDY